MKWRLFTRSFFWVREQLRITSKSQEYFRSSDATFPRQVRNRKVSFGVFPSIRRYATSTARFIAALRPLLTAGICSRDEKKSAPFLHEKKIVQVVNNVFERTSHHFPQTPSNGPNGRTFTSLLPGFLSMTHSQTRKFLVHGSLQVQARFHDHDGN